MDEPRAVGVSVRNLSKSYGKVQALRKVSLEVRRKLYDAVGAVGMARLHCCAV